MIQTLLALALVGAAHPGLARPDDPLPVLIVTGQNNHDWEWTSVQLYELLEASGLFRVDVTTDPGTDLADPALLEKYRAVVLDYNGERWGEAADQNFIRAVKAGLGVTIIHAANNAFPGFVDYEVLCALCWREGTGHGRFHPFEVEVSDRQHPITRCLPNLIVHPDELYHRLVHMHGADHRVLAEAFSDPETGGTGEREPMVIVKNFGQGRIFHTPLGHVWRNVPDSHASFLDSQFRNLVVRGTEWAATGRVTDGEPAPNHLTPYQLAAGWRLLFDGQSTAGWSRLDGAAVTEGWRVIDGCLVRAGAGGDIVAVGLWTNFELEFEWKLARGANSGVKYRVSEQEGARSMLGPEYQLLDTAGDPQDSAPRHRCAALYDLVAPEGAAPAPVGAFNSSRIVASGNHLEHWLNGVCVLTAQLDSPPWRAAQEGSKFAELEGFAGPAPGRIGLQDHGDEVWFRSIRVRDLDELPGEAVELVDGDLSAWEPLGDAVWTAFEDGILGEVGGGGQSFLVSRRSFGDFLLEVDVKPELPGNSGIQIRSHQSERGRFCGYQVEIDSSDRSWSGGLYDEARRGWLDDLADNPAGRAAFQPGQWNRYRIECVGPTLRTWINGVPTADYVDFLDLEGQLGLQVHSGNDTRVRWRGLRLRDLGQREWTRLGDRPLPRDFAARLSLPAENPPDTIEVLLPGARSDGPGGWVDRGVLVTPGSLGVDLKASSIAEKLRGDGSDRLHLAWIGGHLVIDLNGERLFERRDAPACPPGLQPSVPDPASWEVLGPLQ